MTTYNIPGVGELTAGRPFEMTLQFTNEETGEPFLDIVRFPANFLQHAAEGELEALGITTVPDPEPEPDPEPTLTDYEEAIQAHVNDVARSKSYRDGVTCVSYVNSLIPQWAAEAAAFVLWRDNVWAYAYTQLNAVQTGERTQPTIEELLAELPVIEWPAPPSEEPSE